MHGTSKIKGKGETEKVKSGWAPIQGAVARTNEEGARAEFARGGRIKSRDRNVVHAPVYLTSPSPVSETVVNLSDGSGLMSSKLSGCVNAPAEEVCVGGGGGRKRSSDWSP